jgi:hypothetical protein
MDETITRRSQFRALRIWIAPDGQAPVRPIWSWAVRGALLLTPPLTLPPQEKPRATLQKVEANSPPIEVNGPFHEGSAIGGPRPEIQESF